MGNCTEIELNEKCDNAIGSPLTFYDADFIKSDDLVMVKEKEIWRTEFVSNYLCEYFDNFSTRISLDSEKVKKNYNREKEHEKRFSKMDFEKLKESDIKAIEEDDNKAIEEDERKLQRVLYGFSKYEGVKYDQIGSIIDYEIPLKNAKRGPSIDLLSLSKNEVYILELKRNGSPETLLRCMKHFLGIILERSILVHDELGNHG